MGCKRPDEMAARAAKLACRCAAIQSRLANLQDRMVKLARWPTSAALACIMFLAETGMNAVEASVTHFEEVADDAGV
jgi:hypothetical protein